MPARPSDPDWLKQAYAEGRITEQCSHVDEILSAVRGDGEKSEREFQDEVIALAQSHGWQVAHFRTVHIARADGSTYYATPVQADGEGFPDLILVRPGAIIAAELKSQKGKPTAKQTEWLDAFAAAGVTAAIWRPADMKAIEEALR